MKHLSSPGEGVEPVAGECSLEILLSNIIRCEAALADGPNAAPARERDRLERRLRAYKDALQAMVVPCGAAPAGSGVGGPSRA